MKPQNALKGGIQRWIGAYSNRLRRERTVSRTSDEAQRTSGTTEHAGEAAQRRPALEGAAFGSVDTADDRELELRNNFQSAQARASDSCARHKGTTYHVLEPMQAAGVK